jgi:hypothetical protein
MSSPNTEQSPPPASDARGEPVFSPHAHQNASEPPTKQTKGTRWTEGLWTVPLKTLAFREVVGQGWFAIKGQTDNRIRAVSNLNTHQLFVDTGKKLSMGQLLSMVGEETSKRRRQQASDVRATGAGDQQFDALIKLIEDALQLEDDLNAVKQEAENKKFKKKEKEEKTRDRAEKLRKHAMHEYPQLHRHTHHL